MMREKWKPVVGFETSYEVSNHGRVRSFDRVIENRLGIRYKVKGRTMCMWPNRCGHIIVNLGENNQCRVHVLVLEAFVGPCPDGEQGRHLDDVPSNNKLNNLKWGTQSQNSCDAIRNGKKPIGELVRNSKLSDSSVRYIRKNSRRETIASLARRFDVSWTAASHVIKNITWRHVK